MFDDYLILGGAGLVGLQVCRRIVLELNPKRIVVAALTETEASGAVDKLREEFGDRVHFASAFGNLFVPTDLASVPRPEMLAQRSTRKRLLQWLYGDFEQAFADNHLVRLIEQHRPEVVVDCVNTATGLSYQNVFDGAYNVMSWMDDAGGFDDAGTGDLEHFLLSQSVPQLIRHVRCVHRATSMYNTRVYLKVGTTGTGGMGLNIPYTHSEDKPSRVLLAKTEAAFGHTGLLFLFARTPDAPIVKEVKPAAMIGYRGVRTIEVSDKSGNRQVFVPRAVELGARLALREDPGTYDVVGSLELSVVDTGENGLFTRGEFAAITALGQMEYITPEEIAHTIIHEIRGANTGRDVISAVDSAVLDPSYKAGLVREAAMHDLALAEESSGLPSIALGKLGPPELSKLLFEAQLIKERFGSMHATIEHEGRARTARELSAALAEQLEQSKVRTLAPSIGIPVLSPDGATLLRGPRINVPEVAGRSADVTLDDPTRTDAWARKGWIDLRPSNAEVWLTRLKRMLAARAELRDAGSAAASIETYLPAGFEIGEVVAWIFNNEMGGHRIK